MANLVNIIGGESGGRNAGANAALPGYDRALGYYNPYTSGGLADYNRYRGDINSYGDMISGYGNPADYMWQNSSLSPYDAYQNIMAGYMTSPQATYQTEQMQKAADRGASASGMLGSGTYFDSLQRQQQDIIAQDQDRWMKNIMGVGDQQMQQLGNFQGQQNNYWNRMSGLTDLGYKAAGSSAQIEMQKALAEAAAAQSESDMWGDIIGRGAATVDYFRKPKGLSGFF